MQNFVRRYGWYALAISWTGSILVAYGLLQQSLRYAANQPQKSMATEAAANIQAGANPHSVTSGRIDIARSAAPFLIVYDQFGHTVAGDGYLNNRLPEVPIGVLAAAKHHAHTVTWQPQDNVRIASASVAAGNYYVLGGRSLNDTETSITRVGEVAVAAWLAGLVLIVLLARFVSSKTSSSAKLPR